MTFILIIICLIIVFFYIRQKRKNNKSVQTQDPFDTFEQCEFSKTKQTSTIEPPENNTDIWNDDSRELNIRPIRFYIKASYKEGQDIIDSIISVYKCDISNPDGYLVGFCSSQKTSKKIDINKIIYASDPKTGKIISNIPQYAKELYETQKQEDQVDYEIQSNIKPIKSDLKIKYQDAKGKITNRIISVNECDILNPNGYLIGFCHLRQQIRTFRINRIISAVDVETGEFINNLTQFARSKFESSPAGLAEKLLSKANDPVKLLFYIGKADKRFTKKEKIIFLDYCNSVLKEKNLNLDDIDYIIKNIPTPSEQTFKFLCHKLSKCSEEEKLKIYVVAEEMIATEKTVHQNESTALKYMREIFNI